MEQHFQFVAAPNRYPLPAFVGTFVD